MSMMSNEGCGVCVCFQEVFGNGRGRRGRKEKATEGGWGVGGDALKGRLNY